MEHWAVELIGTPWKKGATGPDSYYCWSFVQFVQKTHFDTDLSHVVVDTSRHAAIIRTFITTAEHENWEVVAMPQDGDVVEMGSARRPHHIGVWVAGGVLHCVEGTDTTPGGVCHQTLQRLRLLGWGHIKFLRHKK